MGRTFLGVGIGVAVLGAGALLSGLGRASTPAPLPTAAIVVSASPLETTTPSPSPSPTSVPTPAPTPTTAPTPTILITPYANGGHSYAAMSGIVGTVFAAPFAGSVTLRTYQFIDGEVHVGSNFPNLPFFPYITVTSADRRIIYRPGALGRDTHVLVEDTAEVVVGTPLFETLGDGASSWRTFYDRGVTAQVVVSLATVPGGSDLDAVALLSGR